MADIMSGGLWGAIKGIQSIIESAYISFGKRFTPAIKTLAILFAKLPAPIQEVVVVVGSLAGAMGGLMIMMPGVFGAITRLPGKLVALNAKIGLSTWSVKGLTLAIKNAWRALMGPVGWVIAIGAAAVALGLFWRESQKAENKIPRLAAQIDALTRRIEEQGEATPRQTTRLRKLTEAHEELTLESSVATISIGDLSRAAKEAADALAEEAVAATAAAEAEAVLSDEIAAQLEVRRLQKRQFFHDAVIARNEAKVEALEIEREEAAEVASVLETRRLQKRQFLHDAVIARNESKVDRLTRPNKKKPTKSSHCKRRQPRMRPRRTRTVGWGNYKTS